MTVSPVPSNMKTCSKIFGEKVILSNSFQLMQGYYINYDFFVNKLTTLSSYQKSFTNSNIISKIKCIYWFNYERVIGSQRKTSKC